MQLRGQDQGRAQRHGRPAGHAAVPRRRRRLAPHGGLHPGQPRRVRRLPRHHPARRGHLDRRGVPRGGRPAPHPRGPVHDRAEASGRRAREGRPAHLGRGRAHQVPRQGVERALQAGWPARRADRGRAAVPARAGGRAAVGRRAGHVGEAARRPPAHGRPGGGARAARARAADRPRRRPPPARPRQQPRPAPGRDRPTSALDGLAARHGTRPAHPGRSRPGAHGCRRPGHPAHARGRAAGQHGHRAPAVRRLHPLHRLAHVVASHAEHRPRARHRPPAAPVAHARHRGEGLHSHRSGCVRPRRQPGAADAAVHTRRAEASSTRSSTPCATSTAHLPCAVRSRSDARSARRCRSCRTERRTRPGPDVTGAPAVSSRGQRQIQKSGA